MPIRPPSPLAPAHRHRVRPHPRAVVPARRMQGEARDAHCHPSLLAFGAASLLAVTAATAQVAHGLDSSGNYRQEVKACREGRTAQDLPTCLREARNAEAERRHGTLTTPGSLQANALARCGVFQTEEDKEACRARIVGHVEITGSIEGGGLLREAEVTLAPPPGDTSMGAPSTPASPSPSEDLSPDPSNELEPGTDEDLDVEPALPDADLPPPSR